MRRLDVWRWLEASELSVSERFVYVVLWLHLNETTGLAFPSTMRMGNETGYGVSTVRAALRVLETAGEISREERDGKPSVYRFVIPNPATPPDNGATPPDNAQNPASSGRLTYKNVLNGRAGPVRTFRDGSTFLQGTGIIR